MGFCVFLGRFGMDFFAFYWMAWISVFFDFTLISVCFLFIWHGVRCLLLDGIDFCVFVLNLLLIYMFLLDFE